MDISYPHSYVFTSYLCYIDLLYGNYKKRDQLMLNTQSLRYIPSNPLRYGGCWGHGLGLVIMGRRPLSLVIITSPPPNNFDFSPILEKNTPLLLCNLLKQKEPNKTHLLESLFLFFASCDFRSFRVNFHWYFKSIERPLSQ